MQFDVIVIGAGSGLTIMSAAADMGYKVALVEEGPMGGTCLNRGCIPSKMLIHSADVAHIITNASKFGLKAKLTGVEFRKIVARVSRIVDKDARDIEKAIRANRKITLFKARGEFIGPKTLKVGSKIIKGDKIFIMAGTRSMIPPIKGLDKVKCLTSTEALRLTKQPKHIVIIGGGYIAAELANFFGSLGSKVTILQRNKVLLPRSDREIAEAFTKVYQKRFNVFLGYTAEEVRRRGKGVVVVAGNGRVKKTVMGDQILIATGRVPNSDILNVKKAGIKVNKFGYINTNKYLETTARKVWAGGDIAGKYLFKHSANVEAVQMFRNGFGKKAKPDYYPMPNAVFSNPQIASVGKAEYELKPGAYYTGRYRYMDAAMGMAMQDEDGFVKILVDKKTKKILGCHIMGSEASTLIHEVVIAMKYNGGKVSNITRAVHVHPALPEVVQRAARNLS